MTDAIDRETAIAEHHLQNALQRHARRRTSQGLSACENQDCGAPISPARQANGARLCVPCATAEEAAAAHVARWRQR